MIYKRGLIDKFCVVHKCCIHGSTCPHALNDFILNDFMSKVEIRKDKDGAIQGYFDKQTGEGIHIDTYGGWSSIPRKCFIEDPNNPIGDI